MSEVMTALRLLKQSREITKAAAEQEVSRRLAVLKGCVDAKEVITLLRKSTHLSASEFDNAITEAFVEARALVAEEGQPKYERSSVGMTAEFLREKYK